MVRRKGWAIWRLGPTFDSPHEWYVDAEWVSKLSDQGVYTERVHADTLAKRLVSRCKVLRVARGAGKGDWLATGY